MAATKSASTLLASTSCAANGTQTSSTLNLTTAYACGIMCKITNGSAPTLACTATLNLSPDGTNWYFWASQTAGLAASTAYPLGFDLPPWSEYAQIVFSGNTGQAVTVQAMAQTMTGL